MLSRLEKLTLALLALGLFLGAALWTGHPGAAAGAPAAPAPPAPAAEARKLRVGTYDSRAIAIAWSRSRHFAGQKLIDEAKAAQKAGNQAQFEALQRKLNYAQERAHQQVFSDAPVDNLLSDVADQLPALAAEQRVDLIASGPVYAATGVQVDTLDVTDALVKLFEPRADAFKVIAELRRQPKEWRAPEEYKD